MASVVRCIKLGATDYLVKPFNAVLLKARVNACVDQLRLRALEATYQRNLESEKRRADGILATVLPREVLRALKTGGLEPRLHDNVAVLFCDIVGFTAYSEREPAKKVFQRTGGADRALRGDRRRARTGEDQDGGRRLRRHGGPADGAR